jgi:hypothetical protein
MLFISVLTVLACAWLLNKTVEKPFLNIRDKILRAKYASRQERLVAIQADE